MRNLKTMKVVYLVDVSESSGAGLPGLVVPDKGLLDGCCVLCCRLSIRLWFWFSTFCRWLRKVDWDGLDLWNVRLIQSGLNTLQWWKWKEPNQGDVWERHGRMCQGRYEKVLSVQDSLGGNGEGKLRGHPAVIFSLIKIWIKITEFTYWKQELGSRKYFKNEK